MSEFKKPSFYKYCIVPRCKNNIRKTPDKVFFRIPSGAQVRKQWCEIMKRDNISPLSCLYCCEDHFNVKEDTINYIQYNIMKQLGTRCTLRLKKGVVPHIFMCQKRNMPQPVDSIDEAKQRLTLVNEALSEYAIRSSNVSEIVEPSLRSDSQAGLGTSIDECNDHQVGLSTLTIEVCNNPQSGLNTCSIELCNDPQSGLSTCSIEVCNDPQVGLSPSSIAACKNSQAEPCDSNIEDRLQCDRAVQVNIKPKYRSKGVNVKIPSETKKLTQFTPTSNNFVTSPIQVSALKRKLYVDHPDITSISSFVTSVDYESSSFELSSANDDPEDEKHFKNVMRSTTLTAIEREPSMLLGLPTKSYHLIKYLSDNIPLPTIHILIALKKIKLNESFSILALQFGYSQHTITRVFSESIPCLAAKLKDLIVPASDINKELPISLNDKYANVVSIIDFLEIEIEKPLNLVHQSLTWSQHKKCNTVKYLISCTPEGLVNFISVGYGGRTTNVLIVQDCNYLQYLPSNKAVMVDRGVKELSRLFEAKNCTLIRPSASKTTPSTRDEVKLSQQTAAFRIHLDGVLNRLKEFHMLLPHSCVARNLISIIDYVVIVACGLVNVNRQDGLIKQ